MPGNLGELTTTRRGISPQASADGTVNGASIDRTGFGYAVVSCDVGASTGSPTAISVTFKVQDSADGTTFADVAGTTRTITVNNTNDRIEVDLRGLRQYIRAVATVTHTGGTMPTTNIAASVVLGAPQVAPQA